MPSSKSRKIRDSSSEEQIGKKSNSQAIDEKTEDVRKEVVYFPDLYFPKPSQAMVRTGTSDIFNGIHVVQNINNDNVTLAPVAKYLPAFHSFVSLQIGNPAVRVRFNLPNFVIAPRLLQPEEDAIYDLSLLLKYIGFEVSDRATLAFFAIGSEFRIKKAAQHFVKFHKLANTVEFKCPNREIIESMEGNSCIEGFAVNRDGSFGSLCRADKFGIHGSATNYYVREGMCYILSMVNLELIRSGSGFTSVVNLRNLNWKNFKPFEIVKLFQLFNTCVPIRYRERLMVDPGYYARLAHRIGKEMIPKENVTILLSFDEVRRQYPHLVLPKSLTGLAENKLIKHLSADDQLHFKFLIEN